MVLAVKECCLVRGVVWAFALMLIGASQARATLIVVEPANFPVGTDLSNPAPGLHLSTALSDNTPVPLFTVLTAAGMNGEVFSHVGIPFFDDIRRLRMDFDDSASAVTIDYISSGFFGVEFAHLDVFGAGGQLLQSVTSDVEPAGTVQTLSITRPTNDIQFAVAYSDGLTFGQFDFLRVDVGPVAVPEPSTAVLLATGAAAWGLGRGWRRPRRAVG
jgi:hypothetical protein